MLKLKLQSLGHLMRSGDSFEKTLMLGKIEGGRVVKNPLAGAGDPRDVGLIPGTGRSLE